MRRSDRVILAAVLALGLAIAALSVTSARLGPVVDSLSVASTLDGTSVNTQIGITFTAPMDRRSVEHSFYMSPAVPGDFSWSGNEMFYTPRRSLAYARSYTMTIGSGARDSTGKPLSKSFSRTVRTQSQHMMYLGTEGSEKGRLVLLSLGGKRQVIGPGDGLVTGFSLSFDHSLVVYVKRGAAGERADELWLLSLADDSVQQVFRHGDWSISEPHFSPDGRTVVFLATNVLLCQKYYSCYRDTSGPVVYLLDIRSRRVRPFTAVRDVPLTNFIDFSPAGQIAYTDLGSALTLADPNGQHVFHIPNRGNSLEFNGFSTTGDKAAFVGQTPDSTGGDILVYQGSGYLDVSKGVYDSSTPSFSTSGKSVAYAAYRGELGIEPIYGINTYNFSTRLTLRLTSEHAWSDWSPKWSLDDRYIAFIRSRPQEAMYMGAGEIWVMRGDGHDPHPLGGVGSDLRWVG